MEDREIQFLQVAEEEPTRFPGMRFSDIVKIGEDYVIEITEDNQDWHGDYDLKHVIFATINKRDFRDKCLIISGNWRRGEVQEGIIFEEFNVSVRDYDNFNRHVLCKVSYEDQPLSESITHIESIFLRPGKVVLTRIA